MSRGYSGISKLRRTFRRMEPEIQRGITNKLKDAAVRIEADAVGHAIVQDIKLTGDTIHSITWKMGRDKSSVVIGPGADKTVWQKYPFGNPVSVKMSPGQKKARWDFTKGYWAEFGTAAHGNHPGQKARSFMNAAWEQNEESTRRRMREAVNKALQRSAA